MTKKVIVPQSDLDKLAEARFLLFEILEDNPEMIAKITNGVSNVMYKISHTIYPTFVPRSTIAKVVEQPSNTQMQIDAKSCDQCQHYIDEYDEMYSFCPMWGKALHD